MNEISRDEMRERMGNIDLIRDIIFGSKLGEYDRRLEQLESRLSSLEKDMRDRTEQIKTDCLTELRSGVGTLEAKIKSLDITSQRDSADIRQLIDRTYKNFAGNIESIDKTLVNQTTSIRTELSETREKLQEETRSLKSQIFDELERRFSMLTDAKISRNDMADILFELGLRLKKAEFAPGLREAEHPTSAEEFLLLEASRISE